MHLPAPRGFIVREARNAAAVFLLAAAIGATYTATWGGTPHFFQELFGPAVLFGCGRGFENPVLADAKSIDEFLHPAMRLDKQPDIDRCDCEKIPADLRTQPWSAFQRRQRYLIEAVGWTWRIFGVAWSALAPLYGLLFGASAAALYGIFRLAAGPRIAVLAAALLAFSPIQLDNLLRLRDYAKAPFILGAIFLIALIVARRLSPRMLAANALAFGAVVGIGIGFRMDVLIALPAWFAALVFFCRPAGAHPWRVRAAAALLCLAAFFASSWPVYRALESGMKYQDFLLGLNDLYDARLGVGDAPYRLGHRYFDREPIAILQAYAAHEGAAQQHYEFDTPEYEALGAAYVRKLVMTFPADFMLRACAAVLRTLDELSFNPERALPRGVSNPYAVHGFQAIAYIATPLTRYARYAVPLALLLLAARDPRRAWASFAGLFYFGGYGAVQFATRHYFHMQFIGLLATAYIVARVLDFYRETPASSPVPIRSIIAFALLAPALLCGTLFALRTYQNFSVGRLQHALARAPQTAIAIKVRPLDDKSVLIQGEENAGMDEFPPGAESPWFKAEYIAADFDTSDTPLAPTFLYEGAIPDLALTWSIPLRPTHKNDACTTLIFPAFYARWRGDDAGWTRYRGIVLPKEAATRLRALRHVEWPRSVPIVATWIFAPGWDSRWPCQRLIR